MTLQVPKLEHLHYIILYTWYIDSHLLQLTGFVYFVFLVIFDIFSAVCLELSVPVQVIVMTCYTFVLGVT